MKGGQPHVTAIPWILHQSLDFCEHLLHQFARLRKPLGEETVGVDLDQLTTFEVLAHPKVGSNYFFYKHTRTPDDKLLSQCSA